MAGQPLIPSARQKILSVQKVALLLRAICLIVRLAAKYL